MVSIGNVNIGVGKVGRGRGRGRGQMGPAGMDAQQILGQQSLSLGRGRGRGTKSVQKPVTVVTACYWCGCLPPYAGELPPLPNEIWEMILDHLPVEALIELQQVSRSMRSLVPARDVTPVNRNC